MASGPTSEPSDSPLRLWAGLVALALVGVVGSLPFFSQLLPALVAAQKVPVRLSLGQILLLQGVQTLVLASVAAAAGAWTGPRVGLDAPLLRARLAGEPVASRLLSMLPLSLLAGTLAAGTVLLLSLGLGSRLPPGLGAFPAMSPWLSATSAFYGGIIEELLTRWAILGGVAFLLDRLGVPRGPGFWAANVLAALAFGLLHLPAALQLGVPRTAPVIGYILAGNGVVGLVCGWLFRRRGLESAMVAHASGDIWLHVLLPMVGL
jgi:membrane protease YdiL (CAAX protease family)